MSLNERKGYRVVDAAPDQTAAVFALLPELMGAQVLPPRFAVAHATGDPSCLLGAAAFVPMAGQGHLPGFRSQCRVLPAFRRRGVGRALMVELAAQARQWDASHLQSWEGLIEGPESVFLRAAGFCPGLGVHYFVGEATATLARCQPLVAALRAHERVPTAFQLMPLVDVPLDAAALLFCSQFGGSPSAGREKISQVLKNELSRVLSFALWDGSVLAGFLLAGTDEAMVQVKYWAVDPTFRHGWPAVLLLEHFIRTGAEMGIFHARYHCNDRTQATLNVARKSGAVLEAVHQTYVLDLSTENLA